MRPPRRALCAIALLALAPSAARAATSPVAAENALPGTVQGLLQATATGGSIEGYASEVSALPGDTIHLHVSTSPAAPYRIEVYRLGWYGGTGSRLVRCVPSCGGFEQGQPQPPPTVRADGLVQAGWPVTDSFQLPPDAVSGYYRVRFLLASGQAAATFVIVRPYAWTAPGNQNPFGWEYPLVAFLEQSVYDVFYQTDLDTDRDPSSLLGHRLVLSIGHGEYWTQAMRDAFEAARDQGVNLAFMGANDVYWRIRYEDGGRTIVDYKSGDDPVTDPRLRTGYFRVLDAPECELVGIQHQGGELNWPPGDYAVVPAALASPLGRRWFAGTGLGAGSVVRGVVGVETDTIPAWDRGASCGHALTVFFHHEGGGDQSGNADATAYTAPSGAVVFAAGSKRLAWGLADPPALTGRAHGLVDPRLQRVVRNLLDDLSARRVADLTVTLRPATASVPTGGRVEVRLVVENEGPDPASAATLTVSLPPGLRFVRVASRALRCTLAPLRCALAEIEPGARVAATFTLRATAAGRQPVTARAFTLLAADPEPASATDTVAIVCHRPPDPAAAGTSPG